MRKARPQKKTLTAAAPVPACAGASGTPGAAGGLDLARELTTKLARVTKERDELRVQTVEQVKFCKRLSRELTQVRIQARAGVDLAKARRGQTDMKVYMDSDMPGSPSGYYSSYRGKTVQLDGEREDTGRVKDVLDAMPAHILDRLMAIRVCKEFISLVWNGPVPTGYEDGPQSWVPIPEGDALNIISSVGLLEDRILPLGIRGS